MYISEEKLKEIMDRHDPINGAEDAFYFVYDVMIAEADALKEKCSYATTTISQIETSAYQVYCMAGEIEAENFSEGGEE